MTRHSLNCAMFPNPDSDLVWDRHHHPFLKTIAKHLEFLGCHFMQNPSHNRTLLWLIRNYRNIDVIHFHWPEQIYRPSKSEDSHTLISRVLKRLGLGRLITGYCLLRYMIFLYLCRMTDTPIVWTIHELYPHGQTPSHHSQIDFVARRLLVNHAAALVFNCNEARRLASEEFVIRCDTTIAPLGGYRDFYPDGISVSEAKKSMGINEQDITFLYFGTMRPNRNPLELIQSFRSASSEMLKLIIVGQCGGMLRNQIELSAWGDWRIRCLCQLVPNDQIATLFRACDFLVMPGSEYVTSAVIVLALSYGVPVITPRYGCAIDMVGDAGILYDPFSNTGLDDAIALAIKNGAESYRASAIERSERLCWDDTARGVFEAYMKAISRGERRFNVHY